MAFFAAGCGEKKQQEVQKDQVKAETDKSGWPQRLTLAAGSAGSFSYNMGSPWASTMGNSIGVSISTESTAGLPVNTIMVNNKQADIGICSTDVAYDALVGADWTQGQKLEDVRAITVFDPNVIQMYGNKKSGMSTFKDINGKSVNPSRARSNCDTTLRRLAEVLGVKPSKITNLNPADANGQLGDGLLDVAACMGSIPHPSVSEYEVNHDTVLLGLTREDAQKFVEKYPALSVCEIPAGSYKNQNEPVISVGSFSMAIVSKDLPDSLVYEIVKATFDNKSTLAAAYKPFEKTDPANIKLSPIPLHPGALKYYEEIGIKIPDNLKPAQ
jgi:TRAP transporter TAXI family solute receptor